MPDYLSKEEIRKWRSSLERITLEEYAQRLGKVISEEKETNDIVDIVLKNSSFSEENPLNTYQVKVEKISALAQQSFEREHEIENIRLTKEVLKPKKEIEKPAQKTENKEVIKAAKEAVKEAPRVSPKVKAAPVETVKVQPETKSESSSDDVQLTFKKNLTPREQAVFEHFLNNKNHIVYAKELAQVLDLPRDYVYKYIKNLRAKLNEDAIHNADNGGFVLKV